MLNKTYVFCFALMLSGWLVVVNAEEMQEPTYTGQSISALSEIQLNDFEWSLFSNVGESVYSPIAYGDYGGPPLE